jgi:dUTP pyrophosphatase
MSKYKCEQACIYGCTVETIGTKPAPDRCLYTGDKKKWSPVKPEQFGNSEQLPEPQTEPIKGREMFRGFKVPTYDDLENAVKDFNTGEMTYCGRCLCGGIACDDCLFCCNCGDEKNKISAFAEYARSKGYTITRPGCEEETPEKKELRHTPDFLPIRFKKLHPDAKAPYQATPGSAGFDLTAVSVEPDKEDAFLARYGTGLAVEIPQGHVGLVFPRSSICKTNQLLTNCVGVIDSDYRGEITAVFTKGIKGKAYEVGDRIAQLVIMPIPAVKFVEAEELTETQRGAGGYGSTGR